MSLDIVPKKQDAQPPTEPGLVGDHVLRHLGRPANLVAVQARHLWANNFRVNVFVEGASASRTIAHSYFVVLDTNGRVLRSEPVIRQEYATARPELPTS